MMDIEDATQTEADQIAEQRYGREFDDLPKPLQHDVWCEAENRVRDKLADGSKDNYWAELELMRRLGK